MKKIITIVFIASMLAGPILTLGQQNNSSWISANFGFKNTWILNQNTYGNPEMAYSTKFGFSGGVSYKQYMKGYGYSLGLGIGNMGQNYAGIMGGVDAQRKVNLTYLQLPVMLMYNLGSYRSQTWLSFGPQFMYLLSARQDFSRIGGNVISNPEMLYIGHADVIKRFNPIDMMLAVELTQIFSYEFSEKIKWSLSFDGAIGLSDINQRQYQIPDNQQVYGGSHNFYLGIHMALMSNLKER